MILSTRIAISGSTTLEALCAAGSPALTFPDWMRQLAIIPESSTTAIHYEDSGTTAASATTAVWPAGGMILEDQGVDTAKPIKFYAGSTAYAAVVCES